MKILAIVILIINISLLPIVYSNPILTSNYFQFHHVAIYNTQSSWDYCFTLEDFTTNIYSFKNCSSLRIPSQRYRVERIPSSCNVYRIINAANDFYTLKKSNAFDIEIIPVNSNGGVAIKISNQNFCLENNLSDNNVSPYNVDENQFFKACLPYNSNPIQVFYFIQTNINIETNAKYTVNVYFPLHGDILAKASIIDEMNNQHSSLKLLLTDNLSSKITEYQILSSSFDIYANNSQSGYTVSTNSSAISNKFSFSVRTINLPLIDVNLVTRGSFTGTIELELNTSRIYNYQGTALSRFCLDLQNSASNTNRFNDCNDDLFTSSQYFNIVKISTGPDVYNVMNVLNPSYLLNYGGDSNINIIASGTGYAIKISSQDKCLNNNLSDSNVAPYNVNENQFFIACSAFNGSNLEQVFKFYPNEGEPYTGNVNVNRILLYTKFDDIDANLHNHDIDYMNNVYASLRLRVTYTKDSTFDEFIFSSNDFTINFKQCWDGCVFSTNSAAIGNTKFTLTIRIPSINPQNYLGERSQITYDRIVDYVNTTGIIVVGANTYITFLYTNLFSTGNNPWYPNAANPTEFLNTNFSKLRYDIALNRINISDFSYASSSGSYMNFYVLSYASTASCGGINGTGVMNFRGIPFRIKTTHGITPGGAGPYGTTTLSSSNQVGTLSYNGYCGSGNPVDLGGGWCEVIEPIP